MKIHPSGAQMFHVDGRMDTQTYTTKLTATFHNFANAPKNPQCMWNTTHTSSIMQGYIIFNNLS
jgi:hypothetical protein